MNTFASILRQMSGEGEGVYIDLPFHEYFHPRVAGFGVPSEEREEETFDSSLLIGESDKVVENVITLIEMVESGRSFYIDGTDVSKDVIKLIDHAYGVMFQHHMWYNNEWEEHCKVTPSLRIAPVGLISIDNISDLFEETLFVMKTFLTETKGFLKLTSKVERKVLNRLEMNARLLVPAPNLELIDHESKQFLKPFVNFDFMFGGSIGYHRLERALQTVSNKDVSISYSSDLPGACRTENYLWLNLKQLERDLTQVEEHVNYKIINKMRSILEDVKEFYT